MKTTVEALKGYYTEIGGTSTDVENVVTIPDMIDAITALGGGSSLPDVTADDNGDVLTVVEGEWGKAAPTKELPTVTSSDNGDILGVTDGAWGKVTPTKDTVVIKCTNSTLPNGMTCSDVVALINAGKEVVIRHGTQWYHVAYEAVVGEQYVFIGLGYNSMSSSFFISYISVTNSSSTAVNVGTSKNITTS